MRFVKRKLMAAGLFLVARHAFRPRGHGASARAVDRITEEIEGMGLGVERVLKLRRDSKVVIQCRHPRWGRCVYKGYSFRAPPRLAHAHTAAARLMAARQSALFPAVFEIGDHYSIEEYVQGVTLSEVAPDQWLRIDLVRFVDEVREFGQTGGGTVMSEGERTHIVEYYVRKALHDLATGRIGSQALVLVRLLRRHRELRGLIDAWLGCGGTSLVAGWAINDLNVRNVVVREGSGKLCVIDSEDLGRGHFMFDLVWLIGHACRLEIPDAGLEDACRYMLDLDVSGSERNALFFRRMLMFLLVLNNIRGPSGPTRRLLSAVASDVAPLQGVGAEPGGGTRAALR